MPKEGVEAETVGVGPTIRRYWKKYLDDCKISREMFLEGLTSQERFLFSRVKSPSPLLLWRVTEEQVSQAKEKIGTILNQLNQLYLPSDFDKSSSPSSQGGEDWIGLFIRALNTLSEMLKIHLVLPLDCRPKVAKTYNTFAAFPPPSDAVISASPLTLTSVDWQQPVFSGLPKQFFGLIYYITTTENHEVFQTNLNQLAVSFSSTKSTLDPRQELFITWLLNAFLKKGTPDFYENLLLLIQPLNTVTVSIERSPSPLSAEVNRNIQKALELLYLMPVSNSGDQETYKSEITALLEDIQDLVERAKHWDLFKEQLGVLKQKKELLTSGLTSGLTETHARFLYRLFILAEKCRQGLCEKNEGGEPAVSIDQAKTDCEQAMGQLTVGLNAIEQCYRAVDLDDLPEPEPEPEPELELEPEPELELEPEPELELELELVCRDVALCRHIANQEHPENTTIKEQTDILEQLNHQANQRRRFMDNVEDEEIINKDMIRRKTEAKKIIRQAQEEIQRREKTPAAAVRKEAWEKTKNGLMGVLKEVEKEVRKEETEKRSARKEALTDDALIQRPEQTDVGGSSELPLNATDFLACCVKVKEVIDVFKNEAALGQAQEEVAEAEVAQAAEAEVAQAASLDQPQAQAQAAQARAEEAQARAEEAQARAEEAQVALDQARAAAPQAALVRDLHTIKIALEQYNPTIIQNRNASQEKKAFIAALHKIAKGLAALQPEFGLLRGNDTSTFPRAVPAGSAGFSIANNFFPTTLLQKAITRKDLFSSEQQELLRTLFSQLGNGRFITPEPEPEPQPQPEPELQTAALYPVRPEAVKDRELLARERACEYAFKAILGAIEKTQILIELLESDGFSAEPEPEAENRENLTSSYTENAGLWLSGLGTVLQAGKSDPCQTIALPAGVRYALVEMSRYGQMWQEKYSQFKMGDIYEISTFFNEQLEKVDISLDLLVGHQELVALQAQQLQEQQHQAQQLQEQQYQAQHLQAQHHLIHFTAQAQRHQVQQHQAQQLQEQQLQEQQHQAQQHQAQLAALQAQLAALQAQLAALQAQHLPAPPEPEAQLAAPPLAAAMRAQTGSRHTVSLAPPEPEAQVQEPAPPEPEAQLAAPPLAAAMRAQTGSRHTVSLAPPEPEAQLAAPPLAAAMRVSTREWRTIECPEPSEAEVEPEPELNPKGANQTVFFESKEKGPCSTDSLTLKEIQSLKCLISIINAWAMDLSREKNILADISNDAVSERKVDDVLTNVSLALEKIYHEKTDCFSVNPSLLSDRIKKNCNELNGCVVAFFQVAIEMSENVAFKQEALRFIQKECRVKINVKAVPSAKIEPKEKESDGAPSSPRVSFHHHSGLMPVVVRSQSGHGVTTTTRVTAASDLTTVTVFSPSSQP